MVADRDLVDAGGFLHLEPALLGLRRLGLQAELRAWIETLAAARRAHPALTRGQRSPLLVEPDLYVSSSEYTSTQECFREDID